MPHVKENRSARLFTLLTVCGCAYIAGQFNGDRDLSSVISWLSHIGGNALPGIFWLVSLTVFADKIKLQRWHYLLASLTLVLPFTRVLLQKLIGLDTSALPAIEGLFTYGAMMLELVLICHALYIAIIYWRNDLIEERRLMRGSIIGLTAAYIFAVIIVEQVLGASWAWVESAKFVCLSVLTTGVNVLFFSLRPNTLFATASKPKQGLKPSSKSLSPELLKVTASMEEQQLFREEGITITRLSRHLGIHEYKLRQLINGELSYRNFNDFLNDYRIKDITLQLKDPDKHSVPILTLALDSGFRSLSSFNKVFKEKHGMTPSEFRHACLKQVANTD